MLWSIFKKLLPKYQLFLFFIYLKPQQVRSTFIYEIFYYETVLGTTSSYIIE